MAEQTRRPTEIRVGRTSSSEFHATNERGGTITFGKGDTDDFTPVELLLAAIAGCGSIDVDIAVARRVEPEAFDVVATGDRVSDATGNRVEDIDVAFDVQFPEGEEGDRSRRRLARAIQRAHDVLCTVSRTVELGTPVVMRESQERE